MNKELSGIFAPVGTPFKKDGRIDFDGLNRNLDFYLESRLKGVLILGSNSEYKSLSEEEKFDLLYSCAEKLTGKKILIAGLMYESLYLASNFITKISDLSIDYLLVQPPFYFKKDLTDEDYLYYYKKIASISPFPVLIYNAPSFTGIDFSEKLLEKLSKINKVFGIKEGSKTSKKYNKDFAVLTGTINTLLEKLKNGAVGGVVSFANFIPELPIRIYECYLSGNLTEAEKFQQLAREMNGLISGRSGVSGVKAAMDSLGLCGGWPRFPLKKLPVTEAIRIRDTIKKYYPDER